MNNCNVIQDLFIEKLDVYGYAMILYELLFVQTLSIKGLEMQPFVEREYNLYLSYIFDPLYIRSRIWISSKTSRFQLMEILK